MSLYALGTNIGRIVYSKSGRDKGHRFTVLKEDGEYVYLADGDLRRIDKPKKKKLKHVQPTKTVLTASYKNDAELRRAIAEIESEVGNVKG